MRGEFDEGPVFGTGDRAKIPVVAGQLPSAPEFDAERAGNARVVFKIQIGIAGIRRRLQTRNPDTPNTNTGKITSLLGLT